MNGLSDVDVGKGTMMNGNNGKNGGNGTNSGTAVPRKEWIDRRRIQAADSGDDNFSQMHYARKGLITEEMLYVA